MRPVDADDILKDIEELKKSPWYNRGKKDDSDQIDRVGFLERKEAIQLIVDMFLKDPLTIDAEPVRHGRWVDICETDRRLRECSICHDWQIHYEKYIPKFCPNCGAKMDGEKNETD